MAVIQLVKGDITKMEVDAIVNAANRSLLGGGGVDGAIHRAAGPQLLDECRKLNGCSTGEAKITKGYRLPAKYVIHTVGPIWKGGNSHEKELLSGCYRSCLQIATDYHLQSIAFPNISTGVYGFPKVLAAEIAIKTVNDFLKDKPEIIEVYFVAFDEENFDLYEKKLKA